MATNEEVLKNRLVILGNGFDLAHNLPTLYEDFIVYILKRDISSSVKSGLTVSTYLYEIRPLITDTDFNINELKCIDEITSLVNIVGLKKDNNYNYFETFQSYSDTNITKNYSSIDTRHVQIFFKHVFIEETFIQIDSICWAGFEFQYYSTLLEIIKYSEKDFNRKVELKWIRELNLFFENIKQEFKEYIKHLHPNDKLITRIKEQLVTFIEGNFNSIGKYNPLTHSKLNYSPESIMLLNFNYTQTAGAYFSQISKENNPQLINIHGTYKTNIVFGYGDEIDENYRKIEDRNNNEYLNHFKAFSYNQSSEYHKLLGFIESAPFEVYIMGHSCGLSDRVMLNTIFEHPYCKSIRIFYYKDEVKSIDNFTEITQNISRHFSLNNRATMRSKIISKEYCVAFSIRSKK